MQNNKLTAKEQIEQANKIAKRNETAKARITEAISIYAKIVADKENKINEYFNEIIKKLPKIYEVKKPEKATATEFIPYVSNAESLKDLQENKYVFYNFCLQYMANTQKTFRYDIKLPKKVVDEDSLQAFTAFMNRYTSSVYAVANKSAKNNINLDNIIKDNNLFYKISVDSLQKLETVQYIVDNYRDAIKFMLSIVRKNDPKLFVKLLTTKLDEKNLEFISCQLKNEVYDKTFFKEMITEITKNIIFEMNINNIKSALKGQRNLDDCDLQFYNFYVEANNIDVAEKNDFIKFKNEEQEKEYALKNANFERIKKDVEDRKKFIAIIERKRENCIKRFAKIGDPILKHLENSKKENWIENAMPDQTAMSLYLIAIDKILSNIPKKQLAEVQNFNVPKIR